MTRNVRSGFAAAPILLLIVFVALLIYYARTGIGLPALFPARNATSTASSPPGFWGGVLPGDIGSGTTVIRPGATSSGSEFLPPRDIPAGFTERDLSPYYRKVRISSVTTGFNTSPSRIVLRANLPEGETMNVSRWTFRANRNSGRIGQAVSVYDPYTAPIPGDIILKSGDVVDIYSTESPIGVNVRPNKCFGYLERHIDFSPRFGIGCPALDLAPTVSFTGACQDYIRSLGSCVEPSPNPPLPHDDRACRDYLSEINYAGCFGAHRLDNDFLKSEWRVWAKTKFMDPRHDRILLLDEQGLVVDVYTY